MSQPSRRPSASETRTLRAPLLTRVHDVFDRRPRIGLQCLAAKVAQDDSLVVDDYVQVVFGPQVTNELARPARHDLGMDDGTDARLGSKLALARQAVAQPVDLAREVPIDLDEPE